MYYTPEQEICKLRFFIFFLLKCEILKYTKEYVNYIALKILIEGCGTFPTLNIRFMQDFKSLGGNTPELFFWYFLMKAVEREMTGRPRSITGKIHLKTLVRNVVS